MVGEHADPDAEVSAKRVQVHREDQAAVNEARRARRMRRRTNAQNEKKAREKLEQRRL